MNNKYKWIVLWDIESKYFTFDNNEDFEDFIFGLPKDELHEHTIIKQPNNIIYAEDYFKENLDYANILREQILNDYIIKLTHSINPKEDMPEEITIGNITLFDPIYSGDDNHLVDYNGYLNILNDEYGYCDDMYSGEIGLYLNASIVLKDNCWVLNHINFDFTENTVNTTLDMQLESAWLLQEMGFIDDIVSFVTGPKSHEKNQFYHNFGFVPVFKKDIKEPKVKQISLDIGLYGKQSIDDVYNELERYIAQQDGYKLLNTYYEPTDLTTEYKKMGVV